MKSPRLSAFVLSGSFLASAAHAASQVGTTTATDALSSASRFFTHSANGYYWVAYHDGTRPRIRSSRDGITWTDQGVIFSTFNPQSSGRWATRFSGNNVIAFGTHPSNPNIRYYRNATLNSNGMLTWNAADLDASGAAPAQYEVNALLANNKPILWYCDGTPMSWGEERIGNQLNNPTVWTNPINVAPTTATAGGFSAGALFPIGGNDPNDYIVLRATTVTPYAAGSHRLIASNYDASLGQYVSNLAWYNVSLDGPGAGPYTYTESADTEVKPGTDAQAHTRFAAVRDSSGNIHAVYVNRNDNVVHYKKDVGFNDTWTQLSIDVTSSASAIDKVALAAAGSNNLFLFYAKTGNNGIYFKRYNGSTWSSEQILKANDAQPLQGALAPMESSNGCQIGVAWVQGTGSPYSVMFSLGVGDCTELRTSYGSGKVTIDTPEVQMVWDGGTDGGGGFSELYGKTEANSGVNRSGSVIGYNVFSTQVHDGIWYFEMNTGTLQLLEATPTRVKMRQQYDYTATNHIERDWTVFAYPRVAIREKLTFDTTVDRRGATGLNGNFDTFFQEGQSNSTDKVWIVTDDATTYSDILAIPYTTPFFGRAGANFTWIDDYENNSPEPPDTWIARIHENDPPISTSAGSDTKFYLLYPYLAGLTSTGTEWQPYAGDYRIPDGLSISVGSTWRDSTENTASDDYNEAEGSYTLTCNTSSGLTFQLDGGSNTRIQPFFKIRHWRSLKDPPYLTLNATTTLANDVDYKADVKPFSRAHFYNGSYTELAEGGLDSLTNEYLADSGKNATLNFTAANQYLYLGSDSKFRGINVALQTVGTGASTLQWQYYDGVTPWANLTGVTDETNNLKNPDGTIYWTSDPSGWTPTSINGGPNLYYVRARSSGAYTIKPVEGLIKTDILLLQYCGDVSANGQTFLVPLPTPTAVELLTFEAQGRDGAVELSWETASELKNLGFNLYRASSADGPYSLITRSPIPGLGSSPSGARYRYTDAGLSNGVTYFYMLEDIETTGRTTRHGPVSATPRPGALPVPAFPGAVAPGSVTYGDPGDVSFRVLEENAREMLLELKVGGFYALPGEDGTVTLHVPGLWESNEEGAPNIPVFRTWLPVKATGAARVFSVKPGLVETFSSLRPDIIGRTEVVGTPSGTVELRRTGAGRRFSSRAGLYPLAAARIVEEGFQGEAKKILVEISPLRWDGRHGELLLAHTVTVRVRFSGRDRRQVEEPTLRASSVSRRIHVRERGLYAVRFDEIWGNRRTSIPATELGLTRLGSPVAFHIEPDPDVFSPGSVLYFVSEGASLNPYDREAVYELSREPGTQMEVIGRRPYGGRSVSFAWRHVEREENLYYQAGLLDSTDLWFWDLLFAPAKKTYPLDLESLAVTTDPIRLDVALQGISDFASASDHHVRLFVNGRLVGEETWDGKTSQALVIEIPSSLVREGRNDLEIENVGDTDAPYSMVMLNRYAYTYPSLLRASGGVFQGRFSESGEADVERLGAVVFALDVSSDAPRWVYANGSRFPVDAGGGYLVVSPSAVLTPRVDAPPASRLRTSLVGADYLIIGPRALLPSAQPLLDLRREQGLRGRAVAIEDVYSEFGFGEPRPEALKEFLSYAYHHWRKPAPRYVLLLGDGTYDFKDYLGTGVKNGIPPLMTKTSYLWTASDPLYSSVNGDDTLPDLAIGRLPAQSVEEARAMIAKILAYESGERGGDGAIVLVADNADAAGDFQADAEALASEVPNPERIYLGRLGVEATRAAILDAFDRGPSLVSYVGHGGINLWASENVFNTTDVARLAPQSQRPVVLTLNCLNGYFHFPYFNSLAEELLKAPDKGAVAAVSPSGLSLNEPAQTFHRALVEEIRASHGRRLGDAFLAAQGAYAATGAFPELIRIYHLFGDPALTLR